MKKIVVSVMVLVALSTKVFSVNPNERVAFTKLYNQSNYNSLISYLEVDSVQAKQLKNAFSISNSDLNKALKNGNEIAADKAIWYSLGNARAILSNEQYQKVMKALYISMKDDKRNIYLTER